MPVDAGQHDDEQLPALKPINPNGRSRKLQNIVVAKARKVDELANDLEPTIITKRLKRKQPVHKENRKAKMIAFWESQEEPVAQPKTKVAAKKKAQPKQKATAKIKAQPKKKT